MNSAEKMKLLKLALAKIHFANIPAILYMVSVLPIYVPLILTVEILSLGAFKHRVAMTSTYVMVVVMVCVCGGGLSYLPKYNMKSKLKRTVDFMNIHTKLCMSTPALSGKEEDK